MGMSQRIICQSVGLTTQMPAVIEVVTNREATNGRTITVGSERVRIKKGSDYGFRFEC